MIRDDKKARSTINDQREGSMAEEEREIVEKGAKEAIANHQTIVRHHWLSGIAARFLSSELAGWDDKVHTVSGDASRSTFYQCRSEHRTDG